RSSSRTPVAPRPAAASTCSPAPSLLSHQHSPDPHHHRRHPVPTYAYSVAAPPSPPTPPHPCRWPQEAAPPVPNPRGCSGRSCPLAASSCCRRPWPDLWLVGDTHLAATMAAAPPPEPHQTLALPDLLPSDPLADAALEQSNESRCRRLHLGPSPPNPAPGLLGLSLAGPWLCDALIWPRQS
ncbi:unnamed protein product, partial [Urochloa humidicola]